MAKVRGVLQGSLLPGAGKGLQKASPRTEGHCRALEKGGQRRPPCWAWEGGPEETGP